MVLSGVSLTLDYFQMLIAMTFNVGLFCAVIASYIIATLLFSHVMENYTSLTHARRRAAMAERLGKQGQQQGALIIDVVNGRHGTGSKDAGPAKAMDANLRERLLSEDEAEIADEALGCEECDCVHAA